MKQNEFGIRLKELRERLGLKQSTVSAKVGMSQSHYSSVESGVNRLTIDAAFALYEKFKISIYDLNNKKLSVEDIYNKIQNLISDEKKGNILDVSEIPVLKEKITTLEYELTLAKQMLIKMIRK